MDMPMLVARLRLLLGAVLLLTIFAIAPPASAQERNPDASVNPTASSVKENQLLQELKRIQGRGTIPDARSYTIEQPAGRDWRHFHEVTLRWIGAIAKVGGCLLFSLFFFFFLLCCEHS